MASFSLHTHDITEFFPIISLVYLMAKNIYIFFLHTLACTNASMSMVSPISLKLVTKLSSMLTEKSFLRL